jgi:hypothetical protein
MWNGILFQENYTFDRMIGQKNSGLAKIKKWYEYNGFLGFRTGRAPSKTKPEKQKLPIWAWDC